MSAVVRMDNQNINNYNRLVYAIRGGTRLTCDCHLLIIILVITAQTFTLRLLSELILVVEHSQSK